MEIPGQLCVEINTQGTNHELITRKYLALHGISNFEIRFVLAFQDAIEQLKRGDVDFIMQCAVHPDTPQTLGENFRSVFAIDCFISDSQELAVVSRRDIAQPRSIGVLLPANEKYTDLSKWAKVVPYRSIPLISEALLAGQLDSGLVYKRFADQNPDQMRVDEVLGSPDDVWIVYGKERAFRDTPIGLSSGAFLKEVAANQARAELLPAPNC